MKKNKGGKRVSLAQGVYSTRSRTLHQQETVQESPIVNSTNNVTSPEDITPVTYNDLAEGLSDLSLSNHDILSPESSTIGGDVFEEITNVEEPTSVVNSETCGQEPGPVVNGGTFVVSGSTSASKGRRKKKYLPVQSRYKQAAAAKDRTLELSAIPPQAGARNVNKLKKGGGLSHSTPQSQDSPVALASDGTIFDSTDFQQTTTKPVKKTMRRKTCVSAGDVRKMKEKEEEPVSQLQLDLHYCRQLQVAYVHAKARESFKAQEEKFKEILYALTVANRKLRNEIQEMEGERQVKETELAADQLIKAKVDGLDDVDKKLPNLTTALCQLTNAMRNTERYFTIKNIVIDDKRHVAALEDSKKLLNEIADLVDESKPGVDGLSELAQELKENIPALLSEQKMCADLLSNYQRLCNQEKSLQAQFLQLRNVKNY